MKKTLLSPRFILPLIVLFGVMVMGMRAADMWDIFASGKLSLHPAQAADAAAADKGSADKKDAAPAPAAAPAATPVQAQDTLPQPASAAPPPDLDASPAEIDVL